MRSGTGGTTARSRAAQRHQQLQAALASRQRLCHRLVAPHQRASLAGYRASQPRNLQAQQASGERLCLLKLTCMINC